MNTYPGALPYLQLVTAAAAVGVLDAYDVALLTTLAIRFADYDTGARAWPSLSTLAGFAGTSRAQAKRRLGKLEQLGWLSRTKRDRKSSIISLHVGTGQCDPRVSLTLDNTGQPDPTSGHTDPTLGSGGPHPRVRLTPERTPRTYSKNEPHEQEGGAAVVEVAPAEVPEREAPPSPPPAVEEVVEEPQPVDDANPFAADKGIGEDATTFGIKLRGWLERIHGERGHRSDTLARLAAPLLAQPDWDEARLANRIAAELPAYHARHRHKTRAIASLLSDLASPRPAPETRRTNHRAAPANAYYSDEETARWCAHLDGWDREQDAKSAGGVS